MTKQGQEVLYTGGYKDVLWKSGVSYSVVRYLNRLASSHHMINCGIIKIEKMAKFCSVLLNGLTSMAPFQIYTNLNLSMHSKWRPLLSLDTITHLYHTIGVWTQALFRRWIPLYILTTTAVKLDRRWISAWITHVDGITYPSPNLDWGLTNLA